MHQYFAYGSNMDKEDLDKWCEKKNYPIITPKSIVPAKLVGYRLVFNYSSSIRNCGAANIMEEYKGGSGLEMTIQEGPLDLPIYKITICRINKISL